jgi:hypothetical protein
MIWPQGRDKCFIREHDDFNAAFLPTQCISEMKQKVEIIYEVEETIVLRQGEQIGSAFCPQCRLVSTMIAPRAIAVSSGAKEREIFRLIEAGEIYFVETDGVRVCLSCLHRYSKEKCQ